MLTQTHTSFPVIFAPIKINKRINPVAPEFNSQCAVQKSRI